MKRHTMVPIFLLMLLRCSIPSAQGPLGNDILKKVDSNYVAENRKAISTMVIKGRRGTRTLQAQSWVQGTDRAFTEYLAPPREQGTKMLKIADDLWIYSPSTDRIIKISGHMLRQSLMGSDVSYEDYMEEPELGVLYEATIIGEERLMDRDCYILELTAKKPDVAYHSRRMWVDRERFLPLREQRFAKSGKLLKSLEIHEVFQIRGHWYPRRMTYKDVLQEGEGTEFILDSVEFDVEIPEHLFSKASLRR